MIPKIDRNRALVMADSVRRGVNMYGHRYLPGYSANDLSEALVVLADEVAELDGRPTRDEVSTLKRQLGASKAREIQLKKRLGLPVDEGNDDE